MATSTSSNNAGLSPLNVYYREELLPNLVANLVYGNLIDRTGLPDGKGRTISWIIPGLQPQNGTVLAEGIPVTPGPTTEATVTAQIQEYGNVFAASSLLYKTSVVDAFKYLSNQVEQAGGYAYDYLARQEIFNPAQTTFGVNQFAANQRGSLAAITASDIMTLSEVRFAKFFLKQNNVKPKMKNLHVGVVTVGQAYDLQNSNAGGGFLDIAKQNPLGIEDIKKAVGNGFDGDLEVLGTYGGVALFSTSLNPTAVNASSGVNLHYSAFWGKDSVAGVKIDGEDQEFEVFTRTASKDGAYDVLNMIPLAMGYKATLAFKNLSQDFTNVQNQRVVQVVSASSMF
jgi:N4-gp56 family major capsid protein